MKMSRVPEGPAAPPTLLRIVSAAFIGAAVEWYDFFVYAAAAALAFPKIFFPSVSEPAALLAAFATLGAGFLARPVGAAVFGHFGDRVGRKAMLVVSMIGMGTGTTVIGLLPTYQQIGVMAPIALVFLRLVQGFSVGGEFGGAVLIAVEHGPHSRRGLYGSFALLGVPAGVVLSNLVFLIMVTVTKPAQFLAWGWRIPFLLSAILIGVGLYTRRSISESPSFEKLVRDDDVEKVPLVAAFRSSWRQILLAMGSFVTPNVLSYIAVTFAVSYGAAQLGYSRNVLLVLVLIGSLAWFAAVPVSAALSDRFGRRSVVVVSLLFCIAAAFVFFPLLESGSIPGMALAFVLILAGAGAANGPQAAMFSELFSPGVRYSGISIGYQLGAVIGGGIAPFLAAALYGSFKSSWPITLYMVAVSVVSVVCTAGLLPRRPAPAPVGAHLTVTPSLESNG
jgi:metabolite-proton symporter